eukprot:CAMPEP_0118637754 /NCGR_PEP_ID=MMETSP0785-20121206/3319_1 /TAXON_ID=91992 /ORGANISM="Bolidomonas pacifica, Strain CCMP 1866" /LENGTH=976 /DNA_ID=CAMNT_0006528957 /DNA_START=413 /DNA_END=3339 /DNA_ORIENTATION=+
MSFARRISFLIPQSLANRSLAPRSSTFSSLSSRNPPTHTSTPSTIPPLHLQPSAPQCRVSKRSRLRRTIRDLGNTRDALGLLSLVNSNYSHLNVYCYERVLKHLVEMEEHRRDVRGSPAFALVLHQVRSILCPKTPTGNLNDQFEEKWVRLPVFGNILKSLVALGEEDLAAYIACNAYPIRSPACVSKFVNHLGEKPDIDKVLKRSVMPILEVLPDEFKGGKVWEKNIIVSLFDSQEFADLCLGEEFRFSMNSIVSRWESRIPSWVVVNQDFKDFFEIGRSNREYRTKLFATIDERVASPENITKCIIDFINGDGVESRQEIFWLRVTVGFLGKLMERHPFLAKRVMNSGDFVDTLLPIIARVGGGSTSKGNKKHFVHMMRKLAAESQDVRKVLEGIDFGDEFEVKVESGKELGHIIEEEIREVLMSSSGGIELAKELLKIYEFHRNEFTLGNYAQLFTEIQKGVNSGNNKSSDKNELKKLELFQMACEDVLGTWYRSGSVFSNAPVSEYSDCLLALHRMNIKPKLHVLKHFLSAVKTQPYDPLAIEKFFLTDFLSHPSFYMRISLLREIGKHKHKHFSVSRPASLSYSKGHDFGLLRMIEQFVYHPGSDLRSTSLFFWNHFVSLVKRGKIDYRNGSNKDKITLLHRMNTLARFDPYIELNPKLPQQRMSQLPEEDAVYCRQVAEERFEEKLKFSPLLGDKIETLSEISELLTELKFENELDVPISSDGFTRGGGNLEPITQGSGYNIGIAHVTGWRRIAFAYINDFRHACYIKNKGKTLEGRWEGDVERENLHAQKRKNVDDMFYTHYQSQRDTNDLDDFNFEADDYFEDFKTDSQEPELIGLCAPNLSGNMVPLKVRQNVEVTLKSGRPFYAIIEDISEEKCAATVKYIDGGLEHNVQADRIKVLGGSGDNGDRKSEHHLSQISNSEIHKLTTWQSLGWDIVLVPSTEWNGLGTRREMKRRYLIGKLREVGIDV